MPLKEVMNEQTAVLTESKGARSMVDAFDSKRTVFLD